MEELKKALFALHGLDVEKIFLKKGNPLKEKMIIEELQADVFPEADNYNSYDPHDIASVIKVETSRVLFVQFWFFNFLDCEGMVCKATGSHF